jgi:hypothetical protein
MLSSMPNHTRQRTRAAALLAACGLTVSLAACAGGLPGGVVYPHITPAEGSPRLVTHTFTFEDSPVSLAVTVDGGVYAGATASKKSVTRFGNARENDWIQDYYPAFIEEEHQDAFYDALLSSLRAVRDERALDADRYAELITVFVQSLDYRTDPVDLSPKFPIETFVELGGDCDDKTLLLAGLLSREGYDVAVMLFDAEQHVALGIREDGDGYAGTGYAFVETTTPGFVGMVPDELAGGVTLASPPQVFSIDGGTTRFTAGDEVRAILDTREAAIAEASRLVTEIEAADAELAVLAASVEAERARLDALRAAGDLAGYNAGVAPYNRHVDEYNDAVMARNALAERYAALASLEDLVVDGLADRFGTYRSILAHPL